MKFTKMHGTGNDYVFVNCFLEKVENPSNLSVRVSDRNFGIGSDGLICICPSEVADCRMDMYNADGSRAQMCGNGIRCVGKYIYEKGLVNKTTVTVETLAGIKTLKLSLLGGRVDTVCVDMGRPELVPRKIPVDADGESFVNVPVDVDGETYHITCVSMGNPHAVVFVEDIYAVDLEKIGPKFENHPLFPERINTEFIQVVDEKTLLIRVWERGSGETMACGTGSCASFVAAVLNGKCKNEARVILKGGELSITWNREADRVYMDGPAVTVFDGEFYE